MPRQNRVTPFGDLVAVPARGTLMGNRGCLHDAEGRIRRPYRLTAWIYCLLEFKGRQRAVMSPGRYTELFFLDEATALAAGHRPCYECQRARYKDYMRCWRTANAHLVAGAKLRAGLVDAVLQSERYGPDGEKPRYRTQLGTLPPGCFVELDGREGAWWVAENGTHVTLRRWEANGYKDVKRLAPDMEVDVLTPRSTVNAIAAGFTPRSASAPGPAGVQA